MVEPNLRGRVRDLIQPKSVIIRLPDEDKPVLSRIYVNMIEADKDGMKHSPFSIGVAENGGILKAINHQLLHRAT